MGIRKVSYREDRKGFGAMMVGPGVFRAAHHVATTMSHRMRVMADAEGLRSDEDENRDGIHYADSFEVESVPHYPIVGKYRNPRAAARVINTAEHAPAIEFGIRSIASTIKRNPSMTGWDSGGSRPAHRIMTRSALIFGNVPGGGEE